jgi:hypothetical protein
VERISFLGALRWLGAPTTGILSSIDLGKLDRPEEPIAKVLSDMAVQALNRFRTGGLRGADDLPAAFGVELAGMRSSMTAPWALGHLVVDWHSRRGRECFRPS